MAEAKRDGDLSREGRLRCSLSGRPEEMMVLLLKTRVRMELVGLQGPAARMRMRNPRHKGRPSDEVAQGLPLI